jgi:hypothetical protein
MRRMSHMISQSSRRVPLGHVHDSGSTEMLDSTSSLQATRESDSVALGTGWTRA